MNRTCRTLLVVLLAGVLSGVAVLFVVSPAGAHEGQGVLSIEVSEATGETTVGYIVRLTWANDGHAAIDSTVTATPIAADGTAQTPVALVPFGGEGLYKGSIAFPAPGAWTVRFTAVTPAATLEATEQITPPPTTTTPPTTTAAPPAAPTSTAVAATSTAPAEHDAPGRDSVGWWVAAIAGLLVVVGVVVGGGALLNARRRQ